MSQPETSARGRVRVEPCQKRVRALLGGEVVVPVSVTAATWKPSFLSPHASPSPSLG